MSSKVWLIPNFGSQLGQAVAETALKNGDYVAIGSTKEAREVCLLMYHRYPDHCFPMHFDATSKGDCLSGVATIVDRWKKIDIVLNCTDTIYYGAVEEVSARDLRSQLVSTYYPVVNVTEAVLPVMKRQGKGHIINVSDINGTVGTPSMGLLSAAMHAVEGYSESIAMEVACDGVKITIVKAPLQVTTLTNPRRFAPALPKYKGTIADRARHLILEGTVFPDALFQDTVYAIGQVAGTKEPPFQLVVGSEVVDQLKQRLSSASAALSEFVPETASEPIESLDPAELG